jgi:hypothetical protein
MNAPENLNFQAVGARRSAGRPAWPNGGLDKGRGPHRNVNLLDGAQVNMP